ncbi:LOB domain-containing protein 10-like [Impatiens glandulifera]|uniref:LOB domain-containing protein 10-like n=1 Tax=Impatiens glandulifera TaxID=253017 RepID=UPI001FB08815|nr:LOB domain-containing protein 10-like [Impatiens glandulifera]
MESKPVVCAVCKHNGKQLCDPNCCFARHFMPSNLEDFQIVKQHFGITNFTKLVDKVADDQKDSAIESLVYEATIRRMTPIEGTLGAKAVLQDKIRKTIKELVRAKRKLESLKSTKTPITTPPFVADFDLNVVPVMENSTDSKEDNSKTGGSR